jgi:hypothetical protein
MDCPYWDHAELALREEKDDDFMSTNESGELIPRYSGHLGRCCDRDSAVVYFDVIGASLGMALQHPFVVRLNVED